MKLRIKNFLNLLRPTHLIVSFRKYVVRRRHISFFILGSVVWIGILYKVDSYFRVQDVTFVGKTESDTIIGASHLLNTHMWFIDEQEVQKQINLANPSYVVKEVQKQYPHTLSIQIARLYSSAYLEVGNGYILLSKEGNILQKSREIELKSVPIITYYQRIPYATYQAGYSVDKKDIRDVLYFIEVIKSAKEKVTRIDIAGYHRLRLYTDDHEYVFSSEKEKELQLYQFEQAIRQFQIDGTAFSSIDFRFDKPVVKF